jgi:hypothetical protein
MGTLVAGCALGLMLAEGGVWSTGRRGTLAAPELLLDPNTAPPQVLGALPSVGPALVRQLIAARKNRPLDSLDDAARRVRGLGPAGLARIAPYLRLKVAVEPSRKTASVERGVRKTRKARSARLSTAANGMDSVRSGTGLAAQGETPRGF